MDEGLLKKFSFLARGDVSPLQAFIGSITAQEVVKVTCHVTDHPMCPVLTTPPFLQACSGKFHPIMQWFYFDALECLPENEEAWPSEATAAPVGSRYDGQTAVFGAEFQTTLEKLKYFVVRCVL